MLELIGGIDAFCLSRLVKDQLLVMALVPYGLPNAVRKLKTSSTANAGKRTMSEAIRTKRISLGLLSMRLRPLISARDDQRILMSNPLHFPAP